MAGIGVKLNNIYGKNTLTTDVIGMGYSTVMTIAPMLTVIGALCIMEYFLDFSSVGYVTRELFSCTVLYIFIFALLTASPFNSVLSKYMSDVIYEETYADIMACYYVGLFLNILLSSLVGIPFCIHEYLVGKVDIIYVFTGYCGFIALVFVFYSMLYLSICKDYKKISFFFIIGMAVTVLLSFWFVRGLHKSITYSMLLALTIGFWLIAALEFSVVRSYFRENSGNYRAVFGYFKEYWPLVATNFLYTLGLYIHNFVFWTTDLRMIVVRSFVCVQSYDMATCLAMFTNISASVIFISRVEMHFHERYKAYSEAVIGGRGAMTDPNSPYKKYDTVQAANCGFKYNGMEFVSWNTKADGSGTTYLPGDKFYITETTELYAIWKKVSNPTTEKPSTEKPSPTPSDKPKDVVIGKIYPVGKARYKVTSKKAVMLVSYKKPGAKKMNIPSTVRINGRQFKVTAIGANVCKGNKKLTTVTIGKNVKSIAAKAFYKNKNLKKINIKSVTIAKIGKNAFKGIHKKAVFVVPKKEKKKLRKKLTAKVGFQKKTMKIK